MTRHKRRTISIVIVERWLFLWGDEESTSELACDGLTCDELNFDGVSDDKAKPKACSGDRESPMQDEPLVVPIPKLRPHSITRIITSTYTTYREILSDEEFT